tara:strand:+ start:498 stop:839 length:342 start_codon:yes stop_codon:yes gene_type:complete
MQFPDDIWNEVISYFHSTWRKTIHFEAMATLLSFRPKTGWQRVRNMYDSYYLFLQSDVYLYKNNPEIIYLKIKGPFYFHRVVNTSKIEQDFIEIWDAYSKLFPCHHLIRFVRK